MDNYTGKRIDGRYEIQEVIGVGGMAVVYKAYDNIDDRIVSVKILKDEFLANEEFRRRFKNESKAISLLSHPNIVKVFNVNYGDRLQYIVMEYVEGITLKEYIEQQGRLGIKETIHFTTQILRALHHAHDKGIIHRDIKPQNILLLSNGNIKVTDFGIARFSYSDTKTMTDSAIGSVHYISPEQAKGASIDERTDIYSVGVVMYEMLTGKLPFVSDNSVSVALMQLQQDAKSPRELNPNIPIGLEQIVKKAMEKNTKARYQLASEMLLDIEEFKRNPSIKFQQTYFVDTDPTKYINDNKNVKTPSKPPKIEPVKIDDQEDEDGKKGRGPFIAIGAAIGLFVVGIVIMAVLFFFTDTFNRASGTVPNFANLDYETEIKGKLDKKYNIVVEYVQNSSYPDGLVITQDPSANRKLDNKNQKITIYVAQNNLVIAVPDVYGLNWEQAQTILKNKGFTVNVLPTISAVDEYGTVLKTEPARNVEVSSGAVVTIYYASDEDLIEVPNIVGYDTDMAKSLLESVQLELDPTITEEDSDRPAGEVVNQTPAKGEKVLPGSKVAVAISTGKPAKKVCTISISLPSNNSRGSFEVYVDNENVVSRSLLMDGSNYTFDVEGTEYNSTVKVFIDNKQYFKCKVDFTQNSPKATNGEYSSSSLIVTRKTLPNVVGMSMSDAESNLNAAGFYNIKQVFAVVYNSSDDGKVIEMSPTPGSNGLLGGNTFSTDTLVTIYIGQKDGV